MSKKKSSHSWKRIGQKLNPGTSRAWRRRLWIWMLPIWVLSGLGVAGWGGYRFVQAASAPVAAAPRWQLQTDGTLTPALLQRYLKLDTQKRLMDTSIFALKAQLEQLSQVKEAHVTRIFPDALHIELIEHRAAFRLAASPNQRTGRQRLVSEEGHVFTALGLKRKHSAKLPTLTDVSEAKEINGMPTLLALRKALERHTASLPPQDLHISCRHFTPETPGPHSVLYIKGPQLAQLTLAPEDFSTQLKHLDRLLDYATRHRLAFNEIDLSLSPHQATAL